MPNDTANLSADSTTIVLCIENGPLEQQTLLMLESLRRWGGPVGSARVLAIIPRRGAPLQSATRSALRDLKAEIHDASRYNRIPWYNWYAKVAAARLAEEVATTPVVTWLDSDALIFAPLVELALPHGDDVTVRREILPPAVFNDDDYDRDYWETTCQTAGVRWDDIPWLPASDGDRPQRMMLNAGIYAFRRGCGFAETYEDITLRLMNARNSWQGSGFWHNEQQALMLAIVRAGLKFRELPRSENHMIFDCQIDGPEASPSAHDVRLIHYSKSMYPEFWDRFLARIGRDLPQHHDWLAARGPIQRQNLLKNPGTFLRKAARSLQSKRFARQCLAATARRHEAQRLAGDQSPVPQPTSPA